MTKLNRVFHPRVSSFSLTLVLAFFLQAGFGQIIPSTDSTQCFVAGNGAVFLDNGGNANYANCACFTTTTLCSPDGNPITANFLEFSVFATFDYVQLYNGPDNSGTLLYGNGTGDPGSGDISLADMIASMGTSSFTASSGCITFVFYATAVVDYPGWKVEISTLGSHPGDNLACGTNLSCVQPSNVSIDEVGGTFADISWNLSDSSGTYQVQYDTTGFLPGTTPNILTTSGNQLTLQPLEENTSYDFFLRLLCDNGDSSAILGPYSFTTPWLNDVGVSGIVNPNQDSCLFSDEEPVSLLLKNYGLLPQTFFHTRFAVNGVIQPTPFSDGLYTNVIGMDSTDQLLFETTYDFSTPGNYLIQAWTELATDKNSSNDTFTYYLNTAFDSIPLAEGFESGTVPSGWTHSEGTFANIVYSPNAHNNPTYVISDNLYSGDRTFTLTTSLFGPLRGNDTLRFDYRYVNWSPGTVATNLSGGDSLKVQISGNCGETFKTVYVVDATNHVSTTEMTTVAVDLAGFQDLPIILRFNGVWGAGDYWLDIDNINISGCPINLALQAEVYDELGAGQENGSISVTPGAGTPPYTYIWNDSVTTFEDSFSDLGPGIYDVQVIDANGCTDFQSYTVSTLVNTTTPENVVSALAIFPNPAKDRANLLVKFNRPVRPGMELFNAFGQLISRESWDSVTELNHSIEIGHLTPGLYFVRLHIDGNQVIRKLIVQ